MPFLYESYTRARSLAEYLLDLYIINEKEMTYIPGGMIVDGERYDWTGTSKRLMLTDGTHTFEAVVPAGWKFSKWESLAGDGWTEVEISDLLVNPTVGVTSGNAFLRAYLLPVDVVPPPPEIPTWLKVLAVLGVVVAAVSGGVWLATRPKKVR